MNHDAEHQLRELIRNVIREELKSREVKKDAETGITTSDLEDKEGKKVGYMKHKELPTGGFVAGGRIGPKAAEKNDEAVVFAPSADLKAAIEKLRQTPTHKTKTSQHARVMEKPKDIKKETALEEAGNKENKEKKKEAEVSNIRKDMIAKYGKKPIDLLPPDTLTKLARHQKRTAEKKVDETSHEPEYNKDAVDKAIASSKEKVGGAEAKAIHRLLKGRHGKGSKSVEDKAREMGQIEMFKESKLRAALMEKMAEKKAEKHTISIPVAAFPLYKKGQQPTVINPQTGEEEIESDVSSWAKKAEDLPLEERSKEKKNAVIAKQGRDLKVQYAADQGIPEVPMHVDDERSNKELGRRHSQSKFSKVPSDSDNLDAYNPNTWSTKSLAQVQRYINKLSSKKK